MPDRRRRKALRAAAAQESSPRPCSAGWLSIPYYPLSDEMIGASPACSWDASQRAREPRDTLYRYDDAVVELIVAAARNSRVADA